MIHAYQVNFCREILPLEEYEGSKLMGGYFLSIQGLDMTFSGN